MDTLITFFLKYLLAPVLVVILILVLKFSKIKKKLRMKKVLLFILISLLILALPSLFGLLRYEFVWGGLLITALTYIFLGIALVFYSKTKTFSSFGLIEKDGNKTYFLIVVAAIVILSCWVYYLIFSRLSGLPYSVWAMSSVLWFVIPLFYVIARDSFLKISPQFFKSWRVEHDTNSDLYWEKIDTFTLIQVTVKVKRAPTDKDYSSFVVKLPTEVILGKWFDRFIEDQNVRFPQDIIKTEDESGDDMGWIFYTSRWFKFPLFIRVLDAEKTGTENKITNTQTIFVRRIKIKEDENE